MIYKQMLIYDDLRFILFYAKTKTGQKSCLRNCFFLKSYLFRSNYTQYNYKDWFELFASTFTSAVPRHDA